MAAPPSQSLVLTFEEARQVIEDHASRLTSRTHETTFLLQAAGRVLAEPITADRDIPPFPRSTRDGYAVRASDLAKLPAKLKVIGEIKAGPGQLPSALNQDEAFSIMTGAPVPPSADAVVMVEYTSQKGDLVDIAKGAAPAENIVAQEAEAKRGALLLNRSTRLNEAAAALAASVGIRPAGSIRSSPRGRTHHRRRDRRCRCRTRPNADSQLQQLLAGSADPARRRRPCAAPDRSRRTAPPAPVDRRRLAIRPADHDRRRLHGPLRPGRAGPGRNASRILLYGSENPTRPPSRIRQVRRTTNYFFGLPGNPVSTMVTFELFASPMLEALAEFPAPAHLPARPPEIRNPRQAWTEALPPRNSLRRVRRCRSRTRPLARIRRHRSPRPRQLLHRHPARSRANPRRRMGSNHGR